MAKKKKAAKKKAVKKAAKKKAAKKKVLKKVADKLTPEQKRDAKAFRLSQEKVNQGGFKFITPGNIIIDDTILARPLSTRGEAFNDLCASIERHGVLQPVVLWDNGKGGLVLVAGRHRVAAARRVKIKAIPYVITPSKTKEALLSKSLDENEARITMSVVEEARVLQRAKKLTKAASNVKLGKILGRGARWIAVHMGLLALPTELQEALDKRDPAITVGKCHILLRIAPKFRPAFITPLRNLGEKRFLSYVEDKVKKEEAQWIAGKAKPRKKKKGTAPPKPEGTHSKVWKGKSPKAKGKNFSIDVATPKRIEILIGKVEAALNSETHKKKPNEAAVAYYKGRLSMALEIFGLDPKAPNLAEAIIAFEKTK